MGAEHRSWPELGGILVLHHAQLLQFVVVVTVPPMKIGTHLLFQLQHIHLLDMQRLILQCQQRYRQLCILQLPPVIRDLLFRLSLLLPDRS